jgi:phage terminase large subunit-like protein
VSAPFRAGHNSGDRIEFRPFHSAQRRIMRSLTGRDLLRAGRRFGKTTMLEEIASKRAIQGKLVGWFTPEHKLWTPSYKRILRTIRPLVSHSNKTDALIETEVGGQVEFWTLDNEDAGRSRFYDLVILDEMSLKKKGMRDVWEQAIKPTLLDRNGKVIIAGTPKGIDPDNFYYELSTDALNAPGKTGPSQFGFTEFHVPTWENPMLDADAVAALKGDNAPLVYQQEYCAEFVDWSGVAFFPLPSLLENGVPVPYPARCDVVFATIDTAIKTGKENDGTAVIYWAKSRVGHPLIMLDYDIVQIEGGSLETWLPGVFANLEHLSRECGARMGTLGTLIEDKGSGTILLQQARKRGWPAHEIDSELTAMGKDERAISVSGYVFQGKVKMSAHVHDKIVVYKNQSRNHLISQVCGFRIGTKDPKAQDDLLDAFAYGIAIALGDAYGF